MPRPVSDFKLFIMLFYKILGPETRFAKRSLCAGHEKLHFSINFEGLKKSKFSKSSKQPNYFFTAWQDEIEQNSHNT